VQRLHFCDRYWFNYIGLPCHNIYDCAEANYGGVMFCLIRRGFSPPRLPYVRDKYMYFSFAFRISMKFVWVITTTSRLNVYIKLGHEQGSTIWQNIRFDVNRFWRRCWRLANEYTIFTAQTTADTRSRTQFDVNLKISSQINILGILQQFFFIHRTIVWEYDINRACHLRRSIDRSP